MTDRELLAFLEATRFDRVGVFRYSREEGTKAAKLGEQVEGRGHRPMNRP